MTRVKICGLTRAADAECALDAGAHALGFVFAKSPRQVTPDVVRAIVADLPPLVATIGVFVDAPPEEVRRVLGECGLSGVQLHGSETDSDTLAVGAARVIKGFRIRGAGELQAVRTCSAGLVLVEPYVAGRLGGPGVALDLDLACQAVATGKRIALAGGLSPENVFDIVRRVRPFAVDASSGVEQAPGAKDHAKIRDFIAAVREADGTHTG